MANLIPFPAPGPADVLPDSPGIAPEAFILRVKLHLAQYAINRGIALVEVDLFAHRLAEMIRRDKKTYAPIILLQFLYDPEFYRVTEQKFRDHLGID